MEYLDDLPGKHSGIFPQGAERRAEARFWLDQLDVQIILYFYSVLKVDHNSEAAETVKSAILGRA